MRLHHDIVNTRRLHVNTYYMTAERTSNQISPQIDRLRQHLALTESRERNLTAFIKSQCVKFFFIKFHVMFNKNLYSDRTEKSFFSFIFSEFSHGKAQIPHRFFCFFCSKPFISKRCFRVRCIFSTQPRAKTESLCSRCVENYNA